MEPIKLPPRKRAREHLRSRGTATYTTKSRLLPREPSSSVCSHRQSGGQGRPAAPPGLCSPGLEVRRTRPDTSGTSKGSSGKSPSPRCLQHVTGGAPAVGDSSPAERTVGSGVRQGLTESPSLKSRPHLGTESFKEQKKQCLCGKCIPNRMLTPAVTQKCTHCSQPISC